MASSLNWLSSREDRAWRAFVHVRDRLGLRLHRHLLRDSDLTKSDYEVLAVLSEHPTGRMPSQELAALLEWEKSRLSHQALRMEDRGFIVRETNPADARSVLICLSPAGRRAIENAAPLHVKNVRRHFIGLFTKAELDTLAALNERILSHLAEDPFPDQSTPN